MSANRILTACATAIVICGSVLAAQTGNEGVRAGKTGSAGFDSSKVKVSTEDRVAIQDLFARYSQAIDMGHGDEMVNNVFAPNGTFHDPSLCLVGSAEIRERLTSHPSHVRTSQHWPNNIVITEMSPSADRASVHSYVFLVGPKGIGVVGTYHDTLVKLRGKWLILAREVYRPGAVKVDPRCPTDLSALEP